MNWCVIRAKTKKERFARDYSDLDLEAYVPAYTTKKAWSDRIKKTKIPAIPLYLFFRLKKIVFDLVNLNACTTNVVRASSGNPAVSHHSEIDCLRKYLSGAGEKNKTFLNVDDVVLIGSGCFCSERGILEKFIQKSALVLLKSLNIKLVISPSNLKFQKIAL